MENQVGDQMSMISQLYPNMYTQATPQQQVDHPIRRRRRRKKVKSEADGAAARKRKLSDEQVSMLEVSFEREHKLESERKDRLASELGLDPRQVAVWFQNRRARWKNKKMEEEYSKLKAEHDSAVLEKCRLEAEVLKMKERLNEAESEIQKLSHEVRLPADNNYINSPSSSLTTMDVVMDPTPTLMQPLGELGLDSFENYMFYGPDQNCSLFPSIWSG